MNKKDKLFDEQQGLKKKRPLFIAAAVLIVLISLSITPSKRVAPFFEEVLGSNYQYVKGNEKVIQKSDTQNGITVTVKEILGDQSNVWILYDITKDNGEVFKSDQVKFDAAGVYFPSFSGGNNARQISYGKNSTVSQLMHIDTRMPIQGKNCVMRFSNLIEDTKNETLFDLDISKLLKEYPELIHQAAIINPENGSGDTTAPEYILPKKGLERLLSTSIPDTKLDNIGFVDGQLHMCLKTTFGGLGYFGWFGDYDEIFFKSEGQKMQPIHQSGRGDNDGMYMYLVFDIKDVKSLENLKPYTIYPDITKGKWEIPFKMDYKYSAKKVTPNMLYDPNNKENKAIIKEVTLSPMSLSIFIEGDTRNETEEYGPEIQVTFKDGSKTRGQSTRTTREEESTIIIDSFYHPINMNEVEYIIINNQKIKMTAVKQKSYPHFEFLKLLNR